MFRRIIGGTLVAAFIAAVVYEILDREKPELIEKFKGCFEPPEDPGEAEEVPAE